MIALATCKQRIDYKLSTLVFKSYLNLLPDYLSARLKIILLIDVVTTSVPPAHISYYCFTVCKFYNKNLRARAQAGFSAGRSQQFDYTHSSNIY